MHESSERYLTEAIHTLSQSDPVVKLLHEVRLGRMKATDAGLRAITGAWMSTYQEILDKSETLDRPALRRLDPGPRVEMLIEAGVFTESDAAVVGLRTAYEQALARAAHPKQQ